MKTLLIEKTVNHVQVPLGSLAFDDRQGATLTVTALRPEDAAALRAAWADLSARPELEWDTTVPGEVNGEKVTRYVTKSVKPGSKDYPHAVRDTLQREFHYDIRVP